MLMQTFVSDMLDMQQLKSGIFTLTEALFDPSEIIELVCSIFETQAHSKGISIMWNTERFLTTQTQHSTEPLHYSDRDSEEVTLPKMWGDARRF